MSRMLGWIGILLPWSSLACLLWFEGLPSFSVSQRQGWLLLESLAASAITGLLAVVLGGSAALYAMGAPHRRAKPVGVLLSLGAALPPIITASALLTLFSRISPVLSQGWAPALLTQAMTLAPLAGLILLLTLMSLSGDEIDTAGVFLSESKAFKQVLLPLCRPGILAAFGASATLSLLDFTVPTLFGLTTSMVEVYSDLTAGQHTVSAAWPHFLAALPCIAVLGLWLSSQSGAQRSDLKPVRRLPLPTGLLRMSSSMAVGLGLAFSFLLALMTLQGLGHPKAAQSVSESLPELASSLKLALFSSLFTLPLAVLSGRLLSSTRSTLTWMAALAPACIPPALVGTAVAQASVAVGLEGMTASVLARAVRFLPFSAVISALWWSRRSQEVEGASLVLLPPLKRFFHATLPTASPQLMTLFMAVFALSLGELGATLLVIAPGESTLTIRLYNFLHYGSAPDSAMLTLLLLASVLAPLGVLFIVERFRRA